MSRYWTQIRIREIYDYSTYMATVAEPILGDLLGFGRPIDYPAPIFQPGVLSSFWGAATVRLVADAVGVELDEIRELNWRHPADVSFETRSLGVIEQGAQEAFRFEVQGVVDGKVAIVADHITRMREAAAPQWPGGDHGEGYYIRIEGDPLIECHASFTGPTGDHQYGAILGTAMKVVNSIPAVCEARPGALSAPVDLPPMMGRGLYRPAFEA
jgi:4-hydroxy-tetrahydrodipicolinate reductase